MTGSESDVHGHRWWHSALSAGLGAAAVIVAAVIGKATNTVNVITGRSDSHGDRFCRALLRSQLHRKCSLPYLSLS
jgi:hypothetical protein